jgi:23S rRNA pseudouridine1911/1915/1917 synthase
LTDRPRCRTSAGIASAANLDQHVASREKLTVGETEAGQRLDRFLVLRMPDLSRSRLQALIRAGEVTPERVAGRRPGRQGEARRDLRGARAAASCAEPEPEAIPSQIVYEDAHLIVIDKPKGMPAHPGAGHASGTLVNALLAHCGDSLSGIGGVKRPGIVHSPGQGHHRPAGGGQDGRRAPGAGAQFAAHGPTASSSAATARIGVGRAQSTARAGRCAARPQQRQPPQDGGRRRRSRPPRVTHYAVLETFPKVRPNRWRACSPDARDRPHASGARAHGAYRPSAAGDMVYGSGFKSSARNLSPSAEAALDALARQALHAAELKFEHPVTGKRLSFESELPHDMADVVAALRASAQVGLRIVHVRPVAWHALAGHGKHRRKSSGFTVYPLSREGALSAAHSNVVCS